MLIVLVRVVKYFNTLDGHFLILHYAPPIGFVDQFGTFFVCVDLVVVVEVPLELEAKLNLPHLLHCQSPSQKDPMIVYDVEYL